MSGRPVVQFKNNIQSVMVLTRPAEPVELQELHDRKALLLYANSTCLRDVNAHVILKYHELLIASVVPKKGKKNAQQRQLELDVPCS
jgi:hypothetical protein